MNLTFRAPQGQSAYRIDAHGLNTELAAALGGWLNGWSASHNASEAIVELKEPVSQATIDLVTTTVNAHIAAADAREAAKVTDATRLAAIDTSLTNNVFGGKSVAQLKAMNNAEFDTWWGATVTNLATANTMLKLISRIVLRRLL